MRSMLLTVALVATALTGVYANDFENALNILVSNNLESKAAIKRGVSEVETMRAENVLPGPEAEFSRVWGTNAEAGNKLGVSVSQGFDWPGLYAARKRAADTAESALEFLRASSMLDTRRDARVLLIDYVYNQQLICHQSRYAARLDSMESYYKRAAEEGLETRIDYNKTVIERIGVHRELHQLERDRDALLVRLQAFNGGAPIDEVVRLAGDEYPAIDKGKLAGTLSLIEERDPGYAAARLQTEVARQNLKVAKMSGLPGFSVGYEHESEGGERFNGFSVGISLPSWSRKHASKAAVVDAELALLDAEIMLRQRKADFEEDLVQLDYYEQSLAEYAPIVSDMAPLELLRKALVARQITLLNYMNEYNYFVQANREYLDLMYEYQLAAARLSYYE